jgi:hypothetical protein
MRGIIWLDLRVVDRQDRFYLNGQAALRQNLQLGRDYRDHIARYFGYGAAQLECVLGCENHRVTVISASAIGEDEGHLYELPLPPSLSGIVGIRRLVVSLAWFTPINPLHRDYRRAGLWVSTRESVSIPIEFVPIGRPCSVEPCSMKSSKAMTRSPLSMGQRSD